MDGVTGFYWTLREFCAERYLRFLFADADDERSQLGFVVQRVESELAMAAKLSLPLDAPTVEIGGELVTDFDELVDAIARMTDPDEGAGWGGRAAPGTVHAFMRRLEAAKPHVGQLIRGLASEDADRHRIDTSQAQVTVVDIHRLHDRAQRFVVGVMLKGRVRAQGGERVAPAADACRARRTEQVRARARGGARSRTCCWTSPSAAARSASC